MTTLDSNMLIVLIDHQAPLELWPGYEQDKWSNIDLNTLNL